MEYDPRPLQNARTQESRAIALIRESKATGTAFLHSDGSIRIESRAHDDYRPGSCPILWGGPDNPDGWLIASNALTDFIMEHDIGNVFLAANWTKDVTDDGHYAWWLTTLDGMDCGVSAQMKVGGVECNAPVGVALSDANQWCLMYQDGCSDQTGHECLETAQSACADEARAFYAEAVREAVAQK